MLNTPFDARKCISTQEMTYMYEEDLAHIHSFANRDKDNIHYAFTDSFHILCK